MRFVALVLALCGLMTLAACSGSVSGQVSSKTAHTPVAGATVHIGDQSAVTDTSGRYTISKVSTGDAAVKVTADGYGPGMGQLTVQRGANTLNVMLRNGTVNGTLKENAEATEPIKKAKVTIAGKPAAMTQGAHFTATGVPVGMQTLVVSAPGHAAYTKQLMISPGINDLSAVLNLTPVETYMRYYAAYRFNRWREAHLFVHPDVKRHESYKAFIKDMKQGGIVVGFKLFGSRVLSKWHCPWAKKTYRHVVAIDRSIRYQTGYGAYSDNYTQHWVAMNGRWYIIYDGEADGRATGATGQTGRSNQPDGPPRRAVFVVVAVPSAW